MRFVALLTFLILCLGASAQGNVRVFPQDCNGLPINKVIMIIEHDGKRELPDSTIMSAVYRSLNIYPGASFNSGIASMAMRQIENDTRVASADYKLYAVSIGAPVDMVVEVSMLPADIHKEINQKEGMSVSRSIRDFPLIYQNPRSELTLIMNGAVGLFDDKNGFFGHGKAMTEGNPIATNPEGEGTRFWGEAFLELGVGGIVEFGSSGIYAYGAVSAMATGRNTSDAFSQGGHIYYDFEKLYAGFMFTRLGPRHNQVINLSAGRQEFQLNDGFLISRFSGAGNAGPRASTYLNARRSLHMSAVAKWSSPRFNAEIFYIQPEELTRHSHSRMRYAGAYAGYNDNRHWNTGIALISRIDGEGEYYLPDGSTLRQKGLMVINPKLWVSDIGGTGAFFKSEYAYEWHKSGGMSANGWYVGAGIDMKHVKWTPRLYYRYAFMQGDKEKSKIYTRFDPMLTGGLAEWVQGMNFCKVVGHGNIITHRIEALVYPSQKLNFEFDYYHLQADTHNNIGGGAPAIASFSSRNLGDEFTIQCNWNINRHFMVLGLVSVAIPGRALKDALPSPVKAWSTYQLNLFMFF